MARLLLIRYGEIALKGRNRHVFENHLLENIRFALRHLQPRPNVYKTYGRIFVETPDESQFDEMIASVKQVFGIVAFHIARKVELEPGAIESAVIEEMSPVAAGGTPTTFKVEARRSNKSFPLSSMDLNRNLGAALLRAFAGLKVDVHQPEHIVRVEVRDEGAYVYASQQDGPGGLPVGVSSRGLLLLSGGIDSPVAGWMAMKRGIKLAAIHFHSPPFTSERSKQKVLDLAAVIGRYQGRVPVHVVHFTEIQKAIHQNCPEALGITIMRRMMMRLSEAVATRETIPALITGESVGQVASQTLESLQVINAVTNMPVLRPLVGFDKTEIIDLAHRVGSYDLSVLPYEDCCTVFVPKHPETRPRLRAALQAEKGLDIDALISEALERTETIIVRPEATG